MADPSPPAPRGPWHRLVRVLTAIELAVGVACMVAILVLVFLQAVQRHLPVDQVAWTGEISRFALVWLTFATAGVLVTNRGHIALEIVDAAPHPMVVRVVQTFAMLVVAAVATMLVVEAVELMDSQGIIRSAVLRIPMSWVYVPVLVGVVSTAVRSLVQAGQIAITGPIYADVDDDAEVVA